MLNCYSPINQDRASIMNVPEFEGVSWLSGARINYKISIPIEIELDTSEGSAMVPMFQVGILLFDNKIVKVMSEAGVDNMECFDVVIRNNENGKIFKNYKAVNIVGVISCADLKHSDYITYGDPIIDVDFDTLSIDKNKTFNMLLFRLAECVTGIVVHKKVKNCLEEAGIRYLDFSLPEEWLG